MLPIEAFASSSGLSASSRRCQYFACTSFLPVTQFVFVGVMSSEGLWLLCVLVWRGCAWY